MSFFFHGTPPTEIYTLSLHDALPISPKVLWEIVAPHTEAHRMQCPDCHTYLGRDDVVCTNCRRLNVLTRSEEHTSELQSQSNLVCRLLLEKKKKRTIVIKL